MNKKLAIFDIDKTIYDGYTIFDLAKDQFEKGVISKNTLDSLFENLRSYKSGELEYESLVNSLNINWAKGLKGVSYSEVENLALDFYKGNPDKLFPYFKVVYKYIKQTYDIYFITGESQFVGNSMVKFLNVNGMVSTVFEVNEESKEFSGDVVSQLDNRESKKDAINKLFESYSKEGSLAFGDSEGDIEMLGQVDHAFCVNATDGLRIQAEKKSWDFIDPNELNSVLALLKSKLGKHND